MQEYLENFIKESFTFWRSWILFEDNNTTSKSVDVRLWLKFFLSFLFGGN